MSGRVTNKESLETLQSFSKIDEGEPNVKERGQGAEEKKKGNLQLVREER